jgi:hypothetical protein
VQTVLEKAGVEFLAATEESGPGVRLTRGATGLF